MTQGIPEGPALPQRTYRAFEDMETMSKGQRACVHEFGYAIVKTLERYGVTNPAHIRDVVRECWNGARAPVQYGKAVKGLEKLDWFLIQQGTSMSARTLFRLLAQEGMTIVPTAPTRVMLDASMSTVTGGKTPMTKEEKHRRRYIAAIKAYIESVEHSMTTEYPEERSAA